MSQGHHLKLHSKQTFLALLVCPVRDHRLSCPAHQPQLLPNRRPHRPLPPLPYSHCSCHRHSCADAPHVIPDVMPYATAALRMVAAAPAPIAAVGSMNGSAPCCVHPYESPNHRPVFYCPSTAFCMYRLWVGCGWV